MKKLLLKSMFILLGLVVGVNTAGAQETEWRTVWSTDFSTTPSGFTYSVSNGSVDISSGILYYHQGGGSGDRAINTAFKDEAFNVSTNWKLEFDWNASPANTNPSNVAFATNNGTAFTIEWAKYATVAVVKDAASTILTEALTIAGYKIATMAASTHITIVGDTEKGIYLTINDGSSNVVDNVLVTSTFGYPTTFNGSLGKNVSNMAMDNITFAVPKIAGVVVAPYIKVSKINGIDRELTMTAEDGMTILWSATAPAEGETFISWNTYSAPISVSEPTIYAVATNGSTYSDVSSIITTAGAAVTLEAPVSYRIGAKSYRLTATQTAVDGLTAVPTIHYTIGDGAEQTVANGGTITDVDGDIKAWAVAEGYTNSDTKTITHIAAYETTEIWSYDLSTFTETYGITAIEDAVNESTAKTFDDATYYNLKNIERPNFYIGTGTGWLLRTGKGANNFKVQNKAENIVFDNVYPGLVIYINGNDDKDRYRISSVTNGEVKYYYDNSEYFIVPTTAGAVTVRFGTGVSLNNISVGYINEYTFTKSIPAMGYASFSAPRAVTVPEGVSVYKAAVNAENTAVKLTKVETAVIPANTGVILGAAEGDYNFVVTDETSEADFSDNALIATSVEANATVPAEGTYYALKANAAEFAKVKNGLVISGNKAYLKASESSTAKLYSIVFDEDDDATGINDVNAAVQGDGAYYTLQGVKVVAPTKGLYIVNGKKVIIK